VAIRVVAVPLVALVLLLVSATSIGRGDVGIPVGDVLAVLAGDGAALDVAGALTQAVAHNPAGPAVLGVTGAEAATGAVIALAAVAIRQRRRGRADTAVLGAPYLLSRRRA
jgi:ABC-type enterobactin transport system permease subunit